MSRGPYFMNGARWGARMGDLQAIDYMLGILHDPFHAIHMGITAENVAARDGITREMQDALAVESQQRAATAIAEGRFKSQIVPVEIKTRKGTVMLRHRRARARRHDDRAAREDEAGVQDRRQRDRRQCVRPQRRRRGASCWPAAMRVKSSSLKPIARLVAYAHAGVDPKLMGLGPVPASRAVLKRAGLSATDLDVIESNEAFAAQACAVTRALELDPAKVNPNGSGISLGHPVGATGAIITTKAIYELQRVNGRYALVTMCIGGGQGIAAIFERT